MGLSIVPIYTKLREKKNDLDIYTSNLHRFSIEKTFPCPICSKSESNEKINTILENGPNKLSKLDEESFELIINKEIVDIFEQLEFIEKQRENILETYNEKRYYKHTCEKKKVSCYIIIYKEKTDKKNRYFWDTEYEYSKWKNDENLKNALIKKRQETYDKIQREKKIKKINDEWEEITFKMEEDIYNKSLGIVKKYIKYYTSIPRESEFGTTCDLLLIYDMVKDYFKFISGKRRIMEYLAKYAKCTGYYTDFWIFGPKMSKSEKDEYTQFFNEKAKEMDLKI